VRRAKTLRPVELQGTRSPWSSLSAPLGRRPPNVWKRLFSWLSARAFTTVGAAVALVAGCGAHDFSAQVLSLHSVANCLAASGWTVSRKAKDIGLVGSDAAIGGLYAKREANAVALAFGDDAEGGRLLEEVYRSVASALIVDVDGYFGHANNVAWAWEKVADRDEQRALEGCLGR
jgi:hypothetical protein